MAGDPFQDNSLLLLGGVYDTMGEEFLRAELAKRDVSPTEIEKIVAEIKQERSEKEEG